MRNRAVFLDKDGTLIEDVPYNVDPRHMRLLPGAIDGLRKLDAASYQLIVISNQSGVARGHFPIDALIPVEDRLRELLAEASVPLTGVYFCPHHPDGVVADYSVSCFCRKPESGLILQAADEHAVDLTRSWLIGDILDDIQAGNGAGCKTVLINNGHETEWLFSRQRRPFHVAVDLSEAADMVLLTDQPLQWADLLLRYNGYSFFRNDANQERDGERRRSGSLSECSRHGISNEGVGS
ncbi:MAG: D-glycero-alpha-D-manno-heptose-1,7-bisphosphate 7-phosphatase [Gemmataceae bacterium]